MLFYKALYHICSCIKAFFLKLIYRSKFKISKNVTWRRRFNIWIGKQGQILIGKNCFFNHDCSLCSIEKIEIGDGCIFGENVKIYDHNHKFADLDIPIKMQGYSSAEVKIGKHCWIGSNVVILKGVSIGDNCVVGAGTIIRSDIDSNMIVYAEKDIKKIKIMERKEKTIYEDAIN